MKEENNGEAEAWAWCESEEEKWRERREKKNKKWIKLIPHHSVPLQICNGTIHMLTCENDGI